MKKLISILSLVAFVCCSVFAQETGTFTDSRDGTTYEWVKLKDGKKWMAENLAFKVNDSFCWNDQDSICGKYGRYYTFVAAQNACPAGWSLPTKEQMDAGPAKYTEKELMINGESALEFSKNGRRQGAKKYYHMGTYGHLWTKSEYSKTHGRELSICQGQVTPSWNEKTVGLNVRCIQN